MNFDYFDFEKIAPTMTNEEIIAAINILYKEQQERQRIQHQKLIDNFHKAFSELRNAGIVPKYYDPYEGDLTYIEDWACLKFD